MNKEHVKTVVLDLVSKGNGKFPRIDAVAKALGIRTYQVTHMFKLLARDGFLKQSGHWWLLAQHTLDESWKQPEEPAKISEEPPKALKPQEAHIPVVVPILRWSFLGMGVVAVILSAWYTSSWFAEFLPPFPAWVAGFMYVLFSVMAFELSLLLFKNGLAGRIGILKGIKIGHILGGIGLMFLWLIVLGFSIFSTITGQYNQWVHRQEAVVIAPEEIARTLELKQIQSDRARLTDEKAQVTRLRTSSLNLLDSVKASLDSEKMNGRVYSNEHANIEIYTRQIKDLDKALAGLDARELELTGKALAKTKASDMPDVYEWMSRATQGASRDQIQFWANVAPAIFLDVIAPVGFTVFFFIGGRRKELTGEPYNRVGGEE